VSVLLWVDMELGDRIEAAVSRGWDALPVRVYRESTDVFGIVFYRNYLAWFERGRENVISPEFLALMFKETGRSFVVTRSEQVFKNPALFGDELEVRTIPFLDGNFRLHFDQSVWNVATNTLCVAGFVEMVCVSKEFTLTMVPDVAKTHIQKFDKCKENFVFVKQGNPSNVPKQPMPRRTKSQQDKEREKNIKSFDFELQIHQSDTDFTGIAFHPNYYCWFERARSEFLSHALLQKVRTEEGAMPVIRQANLSYKNGARPYETLKIISVPSKTSDYVVSFHQKMFRKETDQLLVDAKIDIVFVADKKDRALVKVPASLMQNF